MSGSPSNSFSLGPTQQWEGKQAVLLESLFKESDRRWVPPLSAPSNGEDGLSHTKTSQARPFLHTRQKNARTAACYCHRRCSGCLGKKAEMTGTKIRLPYLEKRAQTFRGGCVWWSVETLGERVLSRCRSVVKASCFCCKAGAFLK